VSRPSRNAAMIALAATLLQAFPAGAVREGCMEAGLPTINLHLVDRAGLAPVTRQLLMDETARVWAANNVSVLWSAKARTAFEDGSADAQVVISGDAANVAALWQRPLASVVFVNDEPTPLITVLAREGDQLLQRAEFNGRPITDHELAVRHRLLGRMLGRVAAHELGHLLFHSREHAGTGLMRAHHTVDELIAPDIQAFRIVAPPDVRYPPSRLRECGLARRSQVFAAGDPPSPQHE
jgi:hypothetical protein